MAVRFIRNGEGMAEIMQSPSGPAMRDLTLRAEKLQAAARAQLAAQTKGAGRLSADLTKRPGTSGGQPVVSVGAWNTDYALIVHNGSVPHEIRPKNKKALSFFWPNHPAKPPSRVISFGRGGKVIGPTSRAKVSSQRTVNAVVRSVHHPGTTAIPYLADNLPIAVADY